MLSSPDSWLVVPWLLVAELGVWLVLQSVVESSWESLKVWTWFFFVFFLTSRTELIILSIRCGCSLSEIIGRKQSTDCSTRKPFFFFSSMRKFIRTGAFPGFTEEDVAEIVFFSVSLSPDSFFFDQPPTKTHRSNPLLLLQQPSPHHDPIIFTHCSYLCSFFSLFFSCNLGTKRKKKSTTQRKIPTPNHPFFFSDRIPKLLN